MSNNSQEIVQKIRQEFESMLQYVYESETRTADEVERSLFAQLLGLGSQLMLLFFSIRANGYEHSPLPDSRYWDKIPSVGSWLASLAW